MDCGQKYVLFIGATSIVNVPWVFMAFFVTAMNCTYYSYDALENHSPVIFKIEDDYKC